MKRIRVLAAILAILTALVAGLFALVPGIGLTIVACNAAAALCLAVVVPFDASEPPARKRVLAACVLFVLGIGVALGLAWQAEIDLAPMGMLAGLAAAGLGLAIWSFAVRNRRRRSLWSDYYDR